VHSSLQKIVSRSEEVGVCRGERCPRAVVNTQRTDNGTHMVLTQYYLLYLLDEIGVDCLALPPQVSANGAKLHALWHTFQASNTHISRCLSE
jgi:hypothetical protein